MHHVGPLLLLDSMTENVANILPWLSSSQVNSVVSKWEGAYGAAANSLFDESITGAFPFSWHVSTELKTILHDMNIEVSREEYDLLVKSWGDLKPWTNTEETLKTIYGANITIAVLSNGDRFTLSNAASIFTSVEFSYIFPSDFPAGAFKPQHAIYDQAMQVGYDISEILHVAGGQNDAYGARAAGLYSVQTHSVGKSNLFHGDKVREGDPEPCFVVGDISEVPALLGL